MRHRSSDARKALPPRGRGLARVSALAATLALAAATAGCKVDAASGGDSARPVKVAVVAAGPRGRTLTYSGVIRPRIETALGFRVAGKIVARSVNVGDAVGVDAIIARLDDSDLELAETAARAAVLGARTRRDVARDNLARAEVLLPRAIISQAAYDTRRNELDAAAAALDSAEAQLRTAVNAVGYATLRSDKPGIVTSVTGEPGQVVGAGQAVITLAQAGETEVAVAVPEQEAGRLTIGQPATIALWAGPNVSRGDHVREIAGQADPASRTYAVRIAVEQPPLAMRLGMTATVSLTLDTGAAGIVVPLTALTQGDGGPIAFRVEAQDSVVRQRAVTVAGIAGDGVRIADGLEVGDVVVTAGVQFLRDGMRIRLPSNPAPGVAR